MPKYMLDTDTVSYAFRGQGRVANRLAERPPSQVCISSITLAQLRFGAERRGSRKLHSLIDSFVGEVAVMPLDGVAADRFSVVAVSLERQGLPIGIFDTLIAAHALALGLVLVTNNSRHFERVADLETESWV